MNDRRADGEALRALSALQSGESARVRAVDGGRSMAQRMSMLGIRRGVELRVVHGPGLRGAVVQVGGARIALGRGVIEQIRVEAQTDLDGAPDGQGEHP
ncbi:MAG: FeoA family protein [Gammaproteobacteria bacterium]